MHPLFFKLTWPKGSGEPLSSLCVGRPSVHNSKNILLWNHLAKLWWNGPLVIPFQNCVRQSRPPNSMVAVTKNKKGGWNLKNLHLWNYWANWNSTLLSNLMTSFQNCVRQFRHPTNMATVAKNRKGGWNFNFFPLKLLSQLDSSFARIILWWSPFKILSGSPVLEPRWTLLLFINDSLHIK
jgi:hypothetical protein